MESSAKRFFPFVFVLWLSAGFFFHQDFGISWDEENSRIRGHQALDYAIGKNRLLLTNPNRYHGTAFEIVLAFLESKYYRDSDIRDIFFMRHLANFLLFSLGSLFFYLICLKIFTSHGYSLTGFILYILHPRIAGHAFFNPKDIPFMAVFVISIYTMLNLLSRRSFFNATAHALSCAVLLDIRLVGIIVPFFTVVSLIYILFSEITFSIHEFEISFVYLALFVTFTVLFWPVLWSSPYGRLIEILKLSSTNNLWTAGMFMGTVIPAIFQPWYYLPVWISITTPPFVLFTAIVGLISSVTSILWSRSKSEAHFDLLTLSWSLFPVAAAAVSGWPAYDSWRHFFFIYPAIILLALNGIRTLAKSVSRITVTLHRRIVQSAFFFILIIHTLSCLYQIARLHPFQHVYFNFLAGSSLGIADKSYETDYLGLSYRQALERLEKCVPTGQINIAVENHPGSFSLNMLPPEKRKRFVLTNVSEKTEYYLTNHRGTKVSFPFPLFLTVTRDSCDLNSVYRLNTGQRDEHSTVSAYSGNIFTDDLDRLKDSLESGKINHPIVRSFALHRIGTRYFHKRNYAESLRFFQQAVQEYPANHFSLKGIADILYLSSNFRNAETYYNKSFKLNPGSEEIRRMIRSVHHAAHSEKKI